MSIYNVGSYVQAMKMSPDTR